MMGADGAADGKPDFGTLPFAATDAGVRSSLAESGSVEDFTASRGRTDAAATNVSGVSGVGTVDAPLVAGGIARPSVERPAF
ncbi:MAG: hypothetical protein AAFV19_16830, partial [Pseudomonadota bacterium]